VLYNLDFEEMKDPQKDVTALKFTIPDNPPPTVPERVYILRVDLFDGFELPESISKGCIHITCGPYIGISPVEKVINGSASWNHSYEDIKVTAPRDITQIFDIIIYLSTSARSADRLCYLRIPASTVLYSQNEDILEIKKMTLVEDIVRDKIGDEEFPGILNIRLTFFDQNPPRRDKEAFPSAAEIHNYYENYILRVYLYMGRDLPAADDTGLTDPFVIVRCAGSKEKSDYKTETLNPGWFETIEMEVNIPVIGNTIFPTASISLL
jgi:hypothetical protein